MGTWESICNVVRAFCGFFPKRFRGKKLTYGDVRESLPNVQTFLCLSKVNLIRTQCRLSALMCLVLEMHTRCESKWTQDLDQSLTPPLTFLCRAYLAVSCRSSLTITDELYQQFTSTSSGYQFLLSLLQLRWDTRYFANLLISVLSCNKIPGMRKRRKT